MPDLVTVRRHLAALAAIVLASVPITTAAAPVVVEITGYALAEGRRADYFSGRLLTADDLGNDQEYQRGLERYLGTAPAALDELFRAAGRAGVLLIFDDAAAQQVGPREPVDLDDPQHDDLILLDPGTGNWRGRLFLEGISGLDDGVYEDLSGRFERFATVGEPPAAVAAALAALGWLRRRRRP